MCNERQIDFSATIQYLRLPGVNSRVDVVTGVVFLFGKVFWPHEEGKKNKIHRISQALINFFSTSSYSTSYLESWMVPERKVE